MDGSAAKLIGEGNVTMVDISKIAISTARENAKLNGVPGIRIFQSDGFKSIDDTGYTVILSNPPYHSDFSIAKHFIKNAVITKGQLLSTIHRIYHFGKSRSGRFIVKFSSV